METIELKDIFSILWSKKIIICIIIFVFCLAGVVYTIFFTTPKYEAYTSLVLVKSSRNGGDNRNDDGVSISQNDINVNQNLIYTYSELLKSSSIINEVKTNLKLIDSEKILKDSLSINFVKNTEMIVITVKNKDALLARDIANEIAKVFKYKVEEIYNMNNVYVVDVAVLPTFPYNINHVRDVLVSFFIGIVVSFVYVILSNLLDNTIKNEVDIERNVNLNVLGVLPKQNFRKDTLDKKNFEIINFDVKNKLAFENFKGIRTNIQFMNNYKSPKTILVTSTVASEGKSWVASNLAVTFAQESKRVLLVDSDLRRGRVNKIFGVDNKTGLSNFLLGLDNCLNDEFCVCDKLEKIDLDKEANESFNANDINYYIKKSSYNNLYLLPCGIVPYNPSELLNSDKTKELIEKLKNMFDIIIFDGTPSTIVTDSIILSRLVDFNILVSCYNLTKKDSLVKVKNDIEKVGSKIGGVILNKMPIKTTNYYY